MFEALSGSLFGHLDEVDVLDYFDGPRLVACRNRADQRFLGLYWDENERAIEWLFVAISQRRLGALLAGYLDLHSALGDPEEGRIYRVALSADAATITEVDAASINRAALPPVGDHLRPRQPGFAAEADKESLLESLRDEIYEASREGRPVADLVLSPHSSAAGEIGARFLGTILRRLQSAVDAIAFAKNLVTHRQRPPQLNLIETYGGSFGLRLAADSRADLFGRSPLDEVFDEFGALLATGPDELVLRERLSSLRVAPAKHYREFLRDVARVGSGLTFLWVRADSNDVSFAQMTAEVARRTADLLERIQAEIPATYDIEGAFIALDTDRRTYKFEETSGRRFAGRLGAGVEEAASQLSFGRKYRVLIQESAKVRASGEVHTSRMLLRVEPIFDIPPQ
jgi:hypothetical protein